MHWKAGFPFCSIPNVACPPPVMCVGYHMKLPEEYVRYCAGESPKEGELSVQPLWFQLWPPGDIEQFNRDNRVAEFAPGFLGFGSNGGGELLAFDADGRVFAMPFVGMGKEHAWLVAESWSGFVEKMQR